MNKAAKNEKGCYKKSLNKMKCLDVYLGNMSPEAYDQVKSRIGASERIRYPLLCWDVFSMYLHTIQSKPYDKRRTHQQR